MCIPLPSLPTKIQQQITDFQLGFLMLRPDRPFESWDPPAGESQLIAHNHMLALASSRHKYVAVGNMLNACEYKFIEYVHVYMYTMMHPE